MLCMIDVYMVQERKDIQAAVAPPMRTLRLSVNIASIMMFAAGRRGHDARVEGHQGRGDAY